MNAKNLIFDLDGTLIDPWPGAWQALKDSFATLGLTPPPPETLRWIVGPPIQDSIDKLLSDRTSEERLNAWKAFRKSYDTKGWAENTIYHGVKEAIEALTTHNLFIASSKPEPGPQKVLTQHGLDQHFTGIFGARPLDGRKTKIDVLTALFDQHSLEPSETIMIGDRYHDVEGAKHFSVSTLGVLWGYGSSDELTKAGAIRLLSKPQDLVSLFQS